MTGCHLAGSEIVVGTASQAAEGIVVTFERPNIVFVAHSIIHTTDCGIGKAAVLRIVDLHAIHVDVVVGIIQSAVLEPYTTAPCPAHLVEIYVAV